jgi:ABC-type oligopeptide transport system substrate-binding subunit/class 3 adenylate cyclase
MAETRDERRNVTALFADLVGSTALADKLDPEEVRLIVGEAVARMVRAIEAYGGTVKDLAGDGCLALFGAPVAHEDDPERAILAASRISRDIADYGREVARGWGVQELQARVGVGTGPVVVGMVGAGSRVEYGAFGDTVNVVARLQAAASPGQVLVLDSTRRLVGDRFSWSEPLRLELKGKPEPVTAYEAGSAVPRHAELRAAGSSRLVGREREMAQLAEAASALEAGSGAIVIVSGEPGIGKSRLVAELRERMESGHAPGQGRAARWIVGRCLSYGESLPYWPFRDLLRDWLGLATDEPELRTRVALRRRIESLYGDQALDVYPYLAALLDLELEPEARQRLMEQAPEARQYRTWEVVIGLLARLAEAAPLVVVLEDLHWSDPTSIALLERAVGVADEAAVLLVLTHRAERDHPSWQLRELAVRDYAHRTIALDLPALPGEAERELLNGLVGSGTLPERVAERLLGTAEGNPFFLEELVRSLVDAGALVSEEDGWRFDHDVEVEVPATVGQVINARLDRLDGHVQQVVRAAAVLGRRFDLPLLEAVVDEGVVLGDALRDLQRLDLLREARRWPRAEYQFKHVLIQEAAYATLVEADRREFHQRAARWLEERFAADPAEVAGLLAHHWQAARDDDRAATYLVMSADQARAEHALDEAIGQYRALLSILGRRGQQQEMAMVLFKLAIALHFDLRFEEADRAYEEAFSLWQPTGSAAAPTATLVLASDRMPDDIDPPRSYQLPAMQVQNATLDRLVELGPERTIVPSLAEHWRISEDGLRYVFRLREGARWSDGKPITAHDAEYGLKRNFDRARPGVSVAMLFVVEGAQEYYHRRHDDLSAVGITALDDRHLEIRLVAPAPYLLNILNRADAGPQPRHAIERDADGWTEPDRHVVSGPFRRTESSPERVVLERRDDYGGARRGNVRRVEMVRAGAESAASAYRADGLDMVLAYGIGAHEQLRAAAGEDAMATPFASTGYLFFHHREEPWSNRELRRALAHAMDRDAIGAAMPDGSLVARGGLVPPALHGHTPDIVPRHDPELARRLLDASGVRPRVALVAPEQTPYLQAYSVLVSGWRDVLGLDAELIEVTRAEYVAGSYADLVGIEITGWAPGYPDPEYFLRLLLHSQAKDNFGQYASAGFDELIERARAERDVRRRLDLFHEADRLAVGEDVAVIPLYYARNDAFIKPWVHGWWEYGKAWSSFADLVVDERSPRAGTA